MKGRGVNAKIKGSALLNNYYLMKALNALIALLIHGLKNGLGFIGKFERWIAWTTGYIALTNEEVDET